MQSYDVASIKTIDAHNVRIINNYSPKWRWIVVDIYRAASGR